MNLKQKHELNLRDLGGINVGEVALPKGLFLRSGKLAVLSPEQCGTLCKRYHIGCVIDLRTPLEAEEYPDPLPEGVRYVQMPLFSDATAGITREKGSDPMKVIRNCRKHPEQLLAQIPDFKQLYRTMVEDPYSRNQLDRVVELLRKNADEGVCTLFHCTAGKDRTGIVAMALLKDLGASREVIVRDYMRTNRNAFFPTLRKCIGVLLITGSWQLTKAVWQPFMAQSEWIEVALACYESPINP